MLLGNSARVWFSRDEIEWRVVLAFLLGAVPMTIVGEGLLVFFGVRLFLWPSD